MDGYRPAVRTRLTAPSPSEQEPPTPSRPSQRTCPSRPLVHPVSKSLPPALQLGAERRVLHHEPPPLHFAPDRVRLGEIAGLPGGQTAPQALHRPANGRLLH